MSVLTGVLSGLAVLILGEVVLRLVFNPLREVKASIKAVAVVLMRYADAISNPGVPKPEYMDEASRVIREAACTLQANVGSVLLYRFFAILRLVPTGSSIRSAHANLIGISNSIHDDAGGYNPERVAAVRAALGIQST